MKIEIVTQLTKNHNHGFGVWRKDDRLVYYSDKYGRQSTIGYTRDMWRYDNQSFLTPFRLEIIYDEN